MSSSEKFCCEPTNRAKRPSNSRSHCNDNQTGHVRYSAPHVLPHKPAIKQGRSPRIPRSWTNGSKPILILSSCERRGTTQKAQKNKRHKKIDLCLLCSSLGVL